MIKQLTPTIADYELLDTGDGEKLERFGNYVVRRPEPQAIWHRASTIGRGWGPMPRFCAMRRVRSVASGA